MIQIRVVQRVFIPDFILSLQCIGFHLVHIITFHTVVFSWWDQAVSSHMRLYIVHTCRTVDTFGTIELNSLCVPSNQEIVESRLSLQNTVDIDTGFLNLEHADNHSQKSLFYQIITSFTITVCTVCMSDIFLNVTM